MLIPTNVGGQAVIEGVMMRAASGLAVAVRRQSGEIVVKDRIWKTLGERYPIFKLPGLRGIVVLVETLSGGFDALSFSAEQAELTPDKPGKEAADVTPPSKLGTALTMGIALLFGLGLFVALPHALTYGVSQVLGGLALKSLAFHLVAGAFKLLIFVGYLGGLSLIPDIRRVFMYHGAEHKVIATYEAGEPLDVEHARRHTTFHARCGTSFLLVVVVVAIVLFAIVFPLLPWLDEGIGSHLSVILIKVPMLLPIAGLAYEFNRWAAGHLCNPFVRMLVSPGFSMQRLTTREPTDPMLEVSLTSLKAALKRHEAGVNGADSDVVVYRDFADICSRLV